MLDSLPAFIDLGCGIPETAGLFDHLPNVLFWMKDYGGYYQWVNTGFLINFGLKKREEVLGRTDFDLCGTAMANQYRLDDERVLAGEKIVSRVELIGRFDHTSRWCVTSKIPLRAKGGQVVGTAGVTSPLDEKKHGAPTESPLSAAIRYVSQNYKDAISNDALAKLCGLSLRAFERHFQATYRTSPHDYVRQMRVRMSCDALVHSLKTLAEVAFEYGFSDQSHFTREFRRVIGETPKEYRARFTQ
jgi:AraC-like DNA-binding protein